MAARSNTPETNAAEGVTYTRPRTQVDAERRLADGNAQVNGLNPQNPKPHAEDGFVAVGFEYQNFGNDTDKPLTADEGADKTLEEHFSSAITAEPQPGPKEYQDNYKVFSRTAEVSDSEPTEPNTVAGGQPKTTSEDPAETEGDSVSGGTPTKF